MTEKKKIVIIVPPVPPQLYPIVAITKELTKRKELKVIFFGIEKYRSIIENSNAEYRSYSDFDLESYIPQNKEEAISHYQKFMDLSTKLLPELLDFCKEEKPDMILFDHASQHARYLYSNIKVKSKQNRLEFPLPKFLVFYTTFAYLWDVFPTEKDGEFMSGKITPYMRYRGFMIAMKQGQLNQKFELTIPMDPRKTPNPIREGSICTMLEQFQPKSEHMLDKYTFVGCCIDESVRNIEIKNDKLKNVLQTFVEINPLFLSNNKELISKQTKKLMYVSLGTVFDKKTNIFEKIFEAFVTFDEESNKKKSVFKLNDLEILISVGKSSYDIFQEKINKKKLKLPTNITLVAYAPQIEILKRASLFVTHAGTNSISETIHFGVPVVCIPIDFDQPVCARRACDELKFGIRLDSSKLSSNDIRQAIHEVLKDRSYLENILEFCKLSRKTDGIEKSVEIILKTVNS